MNQEKEPQKKGFLHQLVDVKKEDVTLKFVFDNVRNYGIAATVMVAGFYLLKHGAIINQFPYAGGVFGVSFIIAGLLLLTLNLSQAIWALIKLDVPKLPYFLFSLVMFFGASELTWVLVRELEQKA